MNAHELAQMSATQLAYAAKQLRNKMGLVPAEPIALVGMGCRFPGNVDSPEAYWELLAAGRDAVTEVPSDRWSLDALYSPVPGTPGKMYTRHGAFVNQVDRFDPLFFGISPREAVLMDPQQRLLLETSWEALEHAGLSPSRLRGTATGVFVGIMHRDYAYLVHASGEIDSHTGSGTGLSVAAGRIAHLLALEGPTLVVDTACSSSLVALHLACQSLRNGETDVALAAGVNLMLSPMSTIVECQMRMLSAEGHCKTFDARADGFVRGEGCGVVVLKRLSDALADGDEVIAVLRGSAVNHDGHSSGLLVPNGSAQERVIRSALRNGGVEPSQIDFVEAHGTGTALGDPIEVEALGRVFQDERHREEPLLIGSVKTNIGHTEIAAGMAGLMKAALSLQHRQIPKNLHFQTPNPEIRWNELPVSVVTERRDFPGGPRNFVGVSSFGYSGTNAHVVLEAAPITEKRATPSEPGREHVLVLSAKTASALSTLAGSYTTHLTRNAEQDVSDVCHSATASRSTMPYRLAAVATSGDELRAQLQAFSSGNPIDGLIVSEEAASRAAQVAFLFSGQGSQHLGMGRELYTREPVFRAAMDRCASILAPHLPKPLLEVLFAEEGSGSPLEQAVFTQPAMVALEVSLAEQWKAWGVEPSVVVGHSLGQYAAACVAGVISLEDVLPLVALRGRLMHELPPGGEMASFLAPYAKVAAAIEPYRERLSIAAINGPTSTVISGASEAVNAVVEALAAEGIQAKKLNVSHAFHSPLMHPMVDRFREHLSRVRLNTPRLRIVSDMTGQLVEGELSEPDFWCRHLLQPVNFARAVESIHALGVRNFVEVGPASVLLGLAQRCIPEDGESREWLPSLHTGMGNRRRMLESLATLHTRGVPVDWSQVHGKTSRGRVRLPTTPFERERYWVETGPETAGAQPLPSQVGVIHPLLGRRVELAGSSDVRFEGALGAREPFFLDHHRAAGTALLPAAAHVELALAAGRFSSVPGEKPLELLQLTFERPVALPEKGAVILQSTLVKEEGATQVLKVFMRREQDRVTTWEQVATGRLGAASPSKAAGESLASLRARMTEAIAPADYYAHLASGGLVYGSMFQALQAMYGQEGEALVRIVLPEGLKLEPYTVHPVMLDACFQALGVTFPKRKDVPYLPAGVEGLRLHAPMEREVWASLQRRQEGVEAIASLRVFSTDGRLLAEAERLRFRQVRLEALLGQGDKLLEEWLYALEWHPALPHGRRVPPSWIPTPNSLRDAVLPHLEALSGREDLAAYGVFLQELESLCVPYVLQAMERLGCDLTPGTSFKADERAARLGVVPLHQRLWRRLLEMLTEEGLLRTTGETLEVVTCPAPMDVAARMASLAERYPAHRSEQALVQRCGEGLAEALRGRCDPLELLFPKGDMEVAASLYRDSPGPRELNAQAKTALAQAVSRLPAERTIRVLEIGAGTGGTTALLLPELPAERTEYVFTDISPLFLQRAAQEFRAHPFVTYRTLDIEKDPATQGFEAGGFDIIVAANVLHATESLKETLRNARRLLAPSGMLLIVEATSKRRWVDLTFGLTSGWWRYTDTDLRPTHPLISSAGWKTLFAQEGFSTSAALAKEEHEASLQAAVILARLPDEDARASRRQWLIVADARGTGYRLAERLEARGELCAVISGTGATVADFTQLLKELAITQAPTHVVHLTSLDSSGPDDMAQLDLEAAYRNGCGSALDLLQALLATRLSPALSFVTRGALDVLGDGAPGVAQSPLHGLGRGIAMEYPKLGGTVIDLDPRRDDLEGLVTELLSERSDEQVAFRDGIRRVPRVMRHSRMESEVPFQCREDGTYLITGGLNGLGLLTARLLVERGARHLLLLGRGAPTAAASEQLQELESANVRVVVARADVSQEDALARALVSGLEGMPPLRGVIHSAGALDDGILEQQTHARFKKVFAAKVLGSWNLHRLTLGQPLDFFVLYSSIASLLGNSGQANHSAANTFQDALAHYRRAKGLPALTINWGAWSEVGAAANERVQERLADRWMNPIRPAQGLAVLSSLLSASAAVQVAVMPIARGGFEVQGAVPLLLSALVAREGGGGAKASARDDALLRKLSEVSPVEARRLLVTELQKRLSKVLRIKNPSRLAPERPLTELGLDSLMAIELKNHLMNALGVDLPIAKFIDGASLQELAELTQQQLTVNQLASTQALTADSTPGMSELTL
ncbi:SDR family NAD(P)-dependent oxidoreductase [Myxococcus sp. CA033]|uniref:type I polyketide synthase n=1 Tax=Myxococcus sp. CA033 TaxID=2741516 RepID=UPI00157B85EB|nr:type I polyketide synthase [Myxococcus sp. CA033]NTX32850.1 SDR family NAD(P)-dependent oxidoreductase [Myxococcus sp. CA033]